MRLLLDRVRAGECLVADGAIGTSLLREGVPAGASLEKLNLEEPARIEAISRAFLDAGAEILQTNTFGASALCLARHRLEAETEEINRTAVRIARRAAAGRAYVAASCGPSGRLLKPHGDADPGLVADSFRRQMSALAAEGVDLFCIETMTDLVEASLAVRAAREVAPGVAVSASMTFDATPRGLFTVMGIDVARAARGLEEAGADIVGSNCGNGIEILVRVAREFRRHTRLPLLIRPNAGLPRIEEGAAVYPETPEFFEEKGEELLALGVSILGGCCGAGPEHVQAFRRLIDRRRRSER
ncbi:MAG: homocysteine S-methyltransferase family protein [Candidatus Eisenbacteria bacterium]|nr:homocysteine S-methyltransferase family protein [Candidatus Eisenbacteria bacterium]